MDNDDFGGMGLPKGSWKPVPGNDSGEQGSAKLYIQTGSRMNDLPMDEEEAPF
jgi:replicative DNA helicase